MLGRGRIALVLAVASVTFLAGVAFGNVARTSAGASASLSSATTTGAPSPGPLITENDSDKPCDFKHNVPPPKKCIRGVVIACPNWNPETAQDLVLIRFEDRWSSQTLYKCSG